MFIPMKIINHIVAVSVLLLLLFTSCKKEVEKVPEPEEAQPTADFVVEKSGGKKDPFTFIFRNNSENFKEIRWEFGDDSTSIDENPSHTFLKTGSFKVKVRTMNNKGNWAQKETIIKITPNEFIDVTAKRLSDGSVDLGLLTDADVKSLYWYKGKGTDTLFLKNGEKLNIKLNEGQFENYTLGVKTPNGSIAYIDRILAHVGIVKDITNKGKMIISRENGAPDSFEGSLKSIDNNINTKYLIKEFTSENTWFGLEYYEPVILNAYSLTSANDVPDRDPKDWVFQGSNDGQNWVTLDTRSNELFEKLQLENPNNSSSPMVMKSARFFTKIYSFKNNTSYLYYRLHVKAVKGGTLFQLAEWRALNLPME
jgi:hypothetical protein